LQALAQAIEKQLFALMTCDAYFSCCLYAHGVTLPLAQRSPVLHQLLGKQNQIKAVLF